jgi:hypothetical protein
MLMDFKSVLLDGVTEKQAQERLAKSRQEKIDQLRSDAVTGAIQASIESLKAFLAEHKTEVKNFPEPPNIEAVVKAIESLKTALKPPAATDNKDVVSELRAIQKTIADTPIMPETDLSGLETAITSVNNKLNDVLKAIQAIKVAPRVDVPAPVVNVPKTDLAPIKTGLASVYDAIKEQGHNTSPHIDTDPLIQYLPADIDDSSSVEYFGYIERTGTWYIRRFDTSVSPKTFRFAFGASNYATNWTNRASLTYGYWGS